MTKKNRLAQIRTILTAEREIDNRALTEMFHISPVTLRKDLSELEAAGFLTRTHGGAVLNTEITANGDDYRIGTIIPYSEAKEIIGRIAASFVKDDEWIFIGSGTTAFYMAKNLVHRPRLNVLTNNLTVAFELAKNRNANLIMTGGTLSHDTLNLGGEIFGAYIRDITISKAFIGIAGIDIKKGYTVLTPGESNVISLIQDISDETYIIADDSKYDCKQFIRVSNLTGSHSLITNRRPPADYEAYFRQNHITVFCPDNTQV